MQIKRLDIEGYRSIREQAWLPGNLNLLIGPNASGKSNLIRVLEMFSAAAKGALGKYVQHEGGMDSIVWDGKANNVRIRAKMTPLPPYSDSEKDALTYRLDLARLGRSSAYRVESETLGNYCAVERGENSGPFLMLARDAHHADVYSIASGEFETIAETTTTTTTPDPARSRPIAALDGSLSEEETLLSSAAGPFAINHFAAEFQREVASWVVHQDFQTHRAAPIRLPQIARAETQVHSDGSNLISVLHTLYSSSRDFKSEINSAMRAAFSDDFEELTFPAAADQRIQMRLRWRSLQRDLPAADLSDGTLRFLLLLTVFANPSPPALIAFDEPESGLHPSMLPIVAEFAREASTRSQVILTTHSPDLLDAFGRDAPTTTIVERRDGETNLRVVSGEELSYWLSSYTLGELFRSNELEALR